MIAVKVLKLARNAGKLSEGLRATLLKLLMFPQDFLEAIRLLTFRAKIAFLVCLKALEVESRKTAWLQQV